MPDTLTVPKKPELPVIVVVPPTFSVELIEAVLCKCVAPVTVSVSSIITAPSNEVAPDTLTVPKKPELPVIVVVPVILVVPPTDALLLTSSVLPNDTAPAIVT